MPKHIFKTFLDENFTETNKINLKKISLFFGAPGSGKTYELNKLFKESNEHILYIGRDFENDLYLKDFDEVKIRRLNRKKMFLGSKEEEVDFIKLETNINKLIGHGYTIIFDEVFWENQEEYYKMIERIVISNKFNADLIIVLQHIINNEHFKYERIAKNLDQVVMFKNDIIDFTNIPGEYKIFKREKKEGLSKEQIKDFQKN